MHSIACIRLTKTSRVRTVTHGFIRNGLELSAQRSAGVLAGWLGCVLAAEPPTHRVSLVTQHLRKPRIRRRGRRRASRRDASVPSANAARTLSKVIAVLTVDQRTAKIGSPSRRATESSLSSAEADSRNHQPVRNPTAASRGLRFSCGLRRQNLQSTLRYHVANVRGTASDARARAG